MTRANASLDFLVIGASKCGTTSFWQALDSHPELATPGDKERGFFNSDARYAKGMAAFVESVFPSASPEQRLGTITPNYMSTGRYEQVAGRARDAIPEARLIALLRDPIDRAVSHYRQLVRVGAAAGAGFEEHVRAIARVGRPDADVVGDSEYGRILERWLDFFPREQLLVLLTDELENEPRETYRRTFAFLGVDESHEPSDRPRLNVGGTATRVTPEALAELHAFLDRSVWPAVEDAAEARRALTWWIDHHWNVLPDDEPVEVGAALRAELEDHFRRDAERLSDVLGAQPPWLERWAER